jgi:ABC-type antimicrobial peptide transport system permease subunit
LLWFAACAAVLAATGIYGVTAETMAARRHEMAIRAALGASRGRLARHLVTRPLAFVLVGELLGLCVLALVYQPIGGLLYGVNPYAPMLLGTVVVFVFGLSLAAGCCPAWLGSTLRSGSGSHAR